VSLYEDHDFAMDNAIDWSLGILPWENALDGLASDIVGITCDPRNGHIIILSQESGVLLELYSDDDGENWVVDQNRRIDVTMNNPEGVAFNSSTNDLVLFGGPDEMLVLVAQGN
ncbi:MAG: SdiA-regulated domain-containing protein, partial [Pseudomonadales bacterium]|nr:SdiA-regulated domain-containing protein [Pseudomonadales bacterium]